MTRSVLTGLRPTPLASYLAGLGLVRMVGAQADPQLRAWWTPDELVIESTVDDLAAWLVESYVPTPVLSPWNEGSGFGRKDKTPKESLTALAALPDARLDQFREAVGVATRIGESFRSQGWPKERAVREFRNSCPESVVPWIDASVVLGNEQAYFPPLLGTGGNDGRLDFSTTFHQRLLDVFDPSAKARQRSLSYARDLLAGTQSDRLQRVPVGQFDPGAAGGPNSSPFGGADSLANPWGFILLIEGALLFAASAVRRHQHDTRRAAMPFTVFASPDGSTSGAAREGSRGKLWAPLWTTPFTLPEIRQLFAEARASWNGRPAQRAIEFYAATRTLGVARGVESFERYGLHQRNGLAFVAVPLERVSVVGTPEVRLVARLNDWVSLARRADASAAVSRALRHHDAACLAFVKDGGALPLAKLLAAVTNVELAVGRSGRSRELVPVRVPPRAQDFLAVLRREKSAELRVAVGIASCATRAGADPMRQPSRGMRQLLLPVDPNGRWRDSPVVPGFGVRRLRDMLADVLAWRSRTAADEQDATAFRGVPTFRYGIRVPAGDLHAFAQAALNDEQFDDELFDLWLRACLALRWEGITHSWGDASLPLVVPTLGLLHPLADGLAIQRAEPGTPRLALSPDWAIRLTAGQTAQVHTEAARRLRQAGWRAVPAPKSSTVDGTAIAAALVPRCLNSSRVLRDRFAVRVHPEETETVETEAVAPETETVEERS